MQTPGETQSAFWMHKKTDARPSHNDAGTGHNKNGRRGRPKSHITCWNCNKMGHFSYECENKDKRDNKKNVPNNSFSASYHPPSSDEEEELQAVNAKCAYCLPFVLFFFTQ